jgi:hypothetical protein
MYSGLRDSALGPQLDLVRAQEARKPRAQEAREPRADNVFGVRTIMLILSSSLLPVFAYHVIALDLGFCMKMRNGSFCTAFGIPSAAEPFFARGMIVLENAGLVRTCSLECMLPGHPLNENPTRP